MIHRAPCVVLMIALIGCSSRRGSETSPSVVVLSVQAQDEAGDPLGSTLLELVGVDDRTAVTDSLGRFMFIDVTPGSYRVRAQNLGYHSSVQEVLVDRDTVNVTVVLPVAPVAISGGALPLPGQHRLDQARALLPRLVGEVEVASRLESFAALDERIIVWVPWSPDPIDSVFTTRGREVQATSHCPTCAGRTVVTIEGGEIYEAARPHVRVGVSAIGRERQVLMFCVEAVSTGDSVTKNCRGVNSSTVSYELQASGAWLRSQ